MTEITEIEGPIRLYRKPRYDRSREWYKKPRGWYKLTKKLNAVDNDGDELCVVLEQKGRTITIEIIKCPPELTVSTPRPEPKALRKMTPKMIDELEKIREHAIELIIKGHIEEATELIKTFKFF